MTLRLINAELFKLRTTRTFFGFLIGVRSCSSCWPRS